MVTQTQGQREEFFKQLFEYVKSHPNSVKLPNIQGTTDWERYALKLPDYYLKVTRREVTEGGLLDEFLFPLPFRTTRVCYAVQRINKISGEDAKSIVFEEPETYDIPEMPHYRPHTVEIFLSMQDYLKNLRFPRPSSRVRLERGLKNWLHCFKKEQN